MKPLPILWSFRRCPYAIRARLAVQAAGLKVEIREILLREKPKKFLETSHSGTVPALKCADLILDESLDIMIWALQQSDPTHLLEMPEDGHSLISDCDGPFKHALDRTKYAVRFPDLNPVTEREKASVFIRKLDDQLGVQKFLFGEEATLADFAILPFVRQFANTDSAWFASQDWTNVIGWLNRFLNSSDFSKVMKKLPPWAEGQEPVHFPYLNS